MNHACGNCKFWLRDPNGEVASGVCRANPPQPIALPKRHPITGEPLISIRSMWPQTGERDFCGRWSAAVTLEAAR